MQKILHENVLKYLLLLLLPIGAYYPGLQGPFVFDDFINIVDNTSLHVTTFDFDHILEATLSLRHSDIGRPVAMLSFALNHALGGLDPFGYKLFNVVVHAVNGVLLYILGCALLASRFVGFEPRRASSTALIFSLIWVLHPINLTSVLYVVQRMNSLAAFFMLLGLAGYVLGRINVLESGRGGVLCLLSVWICTILAVLSKENGILLPALVLIVECTIFKFRGPRSFSMLLIKLWSSVLVLGALVLVLGFFLDWHSFSYSELSGKYRHRPFTLEERALTQLRVLWFYIQQITVPDIHSLRLFNDDFVTSKSFFHPQQTLYALVAWVAVLVAAIVLWMKGNAWMMFAVSWYLVGHSLESSVIPLEMVHVHRNYIPMIGPVVAGVVVFSAFFKSQQLKTVVATACIVILFAGTMARSLSWQSWGDLVLSEVKRGPDSSRTHFAAGRWYYWQVESNIEEYRADDFERAQYHFRRAFEVDPYNSSGIYALISLYDLVGRDDVPETLLGELERRLSGLVVTAEHTNKLIELILCNAEQRCSIDLPVINRMINALLSNPKASGYQKAAVTNVLSSYLLEVRLIDAGLYYANITVKNYQKLPQYWQNYYRVAGLAGRADLQQEIRDDFFRHFGKELEP